MTESGFSSFPEAAAIAVQQAINRANAANVTATNQTGKISKARYLEIIEPSDGTNRFIPKPIKNPVSAPVPPAIRASPNEKRIWSLADIPTMRYRRNSLRLSKNVTVEMFIMPITATTYTRICNRVSNALTPSKEPDPA